MADPGRFFLATGQPDTADQAGEAVERFLPVNLSRSLTLAGQKFAGFWAKPFRFDISIIYSERAFLMS